ncbi:MAG: uroporphyrinogen-III synthase [Phenylobacterium sp.]
MKAGGKRGARRIWITRARPGAEATAARVRALGCEPLVAPLLEVRPLTGVPVDLGGVGALAFSSANGVRAFAALSGARDLRVFAVGGATAQAAREAGFETVLSADGDVGDLTRAVLARHRAADGAVLHPSAAEPAGDLVGALAAAGLSARRLTVYDNVAVSLSLPDRARLRRADDVLVHSPKAAEALADLLRESPLPQLRALAISQAAIAPLAGLSLSAKLVASRPREADLLQLIETP